MAADASKPSNLFTPEATIAYVNIFTPRMPPKPKPGQEADYSCTLLFTPAALETPAFTALLQAAKTLAEEKWGTEKANLLIREGKIKLPFKTDIESSGFPTDYKVYIRTKSKSKPGVVSKYEDPKNPGKNEPITNPQELFAGCKVIAEVGLYSYEQEGNKGIGIGLRNLLVMDNDKNLPRLDNRKPAESAFTEFMAPVARPALGVAGMVGGNDNTAQGSRSDLAGMLGAA